MVREIKVMGVLNITPDSFFDGGKHSSLHLAIERVLAMQAAGASIIDVGGESTRPGAKEVSVDEELQRVIPVIDEIRKVSDIAISIDTSKPKVMCEAVKAGASIINDVRALQEPGALEAAISMNVPVCLMHMQGQPRSMQQSPFYHDVVVEVHDFLLSRAEVCRAQGLSADKIWIDPGFGFGKTNNHNLFLLKNLEKLTQGLYPVLVGMSRKSMVGKILDVPVEERLSGSLALATIACLKGASIIRAHDVKETVDVVKVCQSVMQAN